LIHISDFGGTSPVTKIFFFSLPLPKVGRSCFPTGTIYVSALRQPSRVRVPVFSPLPLRLLPLTRLEYVLPPAAMGPHLDPRKPLFFFPPGPMSLPLKRRLVSRRWLWGVSHQSPCVLALLKRRDAAFHGLDSKNHSLPQTSLAPPSVSCLVAH